MSDTHNTHENLVKSLVLAYERFLGRMKSIQKEHDKNMLSDWEKQTQDQELEKIRGQLDT